MPDVAAVAAVDRRQPQVHARRGDRNVIAAVGGAVDAIVDIGRGHGDDGRIGGRIERRRRRPGVAGGGDQDDAALTRRGQAALDPRIARSGKAHIDDARAAGHRPLERLDDVGAGAVHAAALGAERARDQDVRAGRGATQPRPRSDGADDRRPVRMHAVAAADGIEGVEDHPRQFRMLRIGAGIDDRDQHALPGCERVRLRHPHAGERILLERRLRIADTASCSVAIRFGWTVNPSAASARTTAGTPPVVDPQAADRRAGGLQVQRLELCEAMPAQQRVHRLRRDGGCDFDHHLVRHIAAPVGGRLVRLRRRCRRHHRHHHRRSTADPTWDRPAA